MTITGHRKEFGLFPGFPGGSDDKESVCNAGDRGSTPELGQSPRERYGNPFQYSCLENPMTEESSGLQSIGSHRVTFHTEPLEGWLCSVSVLEEDEEGGTCRYPTFPPNFHQQANIFLSSLSPLRPFPGP